MIDYFRPVSIKLLKWNEFMILVITRIWDLKKKKNQPIVNQVLKILIQFPHTISLKPMDSFGTWRKFKINIFLLLRQNFIELYELLMPC